MSDPEAIPLSYGHESKYRRWRRTRRVLKWLGLSAAVLMIAAVITHAIWLWVATARFDRAMAALTAAGEPLTAAALAPPIVPAADNGFDDLAAAARALAADVPARQRRDRLTDPRPPLTGFERQRLMAWQTTAAGQLPRLDRALSKPRLVTTVAFTSPIVQTLMPTLTGERYAARLLGDAALLAHDAGRHREAFARARQIGRVAESTGSNPVLVGALVAVGVRAMQADLITDLAPTLNIGDAPDAVPPADVRAMIDDLLDPRPGAEEMARALRGDRVFGLELIDSLANGTSAGQVLSQTVPQQGYTRIGRYVAGPVLRSNANTLLQLCDLKIAAAAAPDWPAAQAILNRAGPPPAGLNKLTGYLAHLLVGTAGREIQVRYRVNAERGLAAAALAARWYELDHGRRPATLAAMVPTYLPFVPPDPLAANGRPISAKLDGDAPAYWSVGENGTDEGGNDTPTAKRHHAYTPMPWDRLDRVVALAPPPREFDDETQALMTLDPDGPIAPAAAASWSPPTTSTATAPTTAPAGVTVPPWTDVLEIDLRGDAKALGVSTRREVLFMLRESAEVPVGDPAAVAPNGPPAVWGRARFNDGWWGVALWPDGTGRLQSPAGNVTPVRRPPGPPADDGREW